MKIDKTKILITTSLLSGVVGGLISSEVDAEHVSSMRPGGIYQFRTSSTRIQFDSVYPKMLSNGEWVWCIEPSVWIVGEDPNYRPSGDIMNDTIITRDNVGGRFTLNQAERQTAALFPYVVLDMDLDMIDQIMQRAADNGKAFESFRTGAGAKANSQKIKRMLTWIRQQPEHVRYTTVQQFYWQFVLTEQKIQSPRQVAQYTGSGAAPAWMIQDINDALLMKTAPEDAQFIPSGDTRPWLMTGYHWVKHFITAAFESEAIQYEGGATVYTTTTINGEGMTGQSVVAARRGRFSLVPLKQAFIKVNKSTIDVNGVMHSPMNYQGVKIGAYTDANATDLHGTMTIGANGESDVLKVKPGQKYYLFELTSGGQPIKTAEQLVMTGRPYTGGKFDGQNAFGMEIQIEAGQHISEDDPKVYSLKNVPEIVNARFRKESKALFRKNSKQFSIAGAEYTLYKTKADADAKRNGVQTVTVNDQGIGEFTNLTRGVYYARETKVPKINTQSGEKNTHLISNVVHTLDLTSGGTKATETSTDATGQNFPVREFLFTDVYRDLESTVPTGDPDEEFAQKIDNATKQAIGQGFGTLQGAEYKVEFYEPSIFNDGQRGELIFSAIYKTDADGILNIFDKSSYVPNSFTSDRQSFTSREFENMYLALEQGGSWIIADMVLKEVNASDGYHVSDEIKEIKATLTDSDDLEMEAVDVDLFEDAFTLTLVKRQKVENEWQTDQNLAIPGTKFKLTNTTNGKSEVLTVGNDGKAKFSGLGVGNYELKEIEVPKGYQLNKQTITFTVAKNAKITASSTSIETDDDGNYRIDWAANRVSPHTNIKEDLDITVDNIPTRATMKVVKVNEKGTPLKGATFTLTRLNDAGTSPRQGEKPIEVTTNDQGIANFDNLVVGDYYTIEETKAPVGYKLPRDKQVVKFRAESIPVKDSFAVTYNFNMLDQYDTSNTQAVDKGGKLTQPANAISVTTNEKTVNGLSFTVDANEQMHLTLNQVNHTWQKLPATGLNTGLIAGAVSMTLVFAGAAGIAYKRQRS